MARYTTYSTYLREMFGGARIQKVTINAGFTCPNRDGLRGMGGCTFCLNEAFSPSYCSPEKSITTQIDEGIGFHAHRYAKSERFLAYFQTFSNTYKSLDELRKIYDEALSHPSIVGLVVGTRPDCIDQDKLRYFRDLSRDKYVMIEYGVESIFDRTLERVNRGHTFAQAKSAICMTADMGLHVGAHFILGLPGEQRAEAMETARVVSSLPLNTVKFHQLQLFRGTRMAEEFFNDPTDFTLYDLDQYIDLFVDMLEIMPPKLVVERFAGEAPPRYHAVPNKWGSIRNERLVQLLEKRLEERDTFQGKIFKQAIGFTID